MNKGTLFGAATAFLLVSGCSSADKPKKKEGITFPQEVGDITVLKDENRVLQITRQKAYGDSAAEVTTRIWEFGDVKQVCDETIYARQALWSTQVERTKTCLSLDNADPQKVEEMRARLEDASPAP